MLTLESVTSNHSTGSNQWAAIEVASVVGSGDPLCGDPGSLYSYNDFVIPAPPSPSGCGNPIQLLHTCWQDPFCMYAGFHNTALYSRKLSGGGGGGGMTGSCEFEWSVEWNMNIVGYVQKRVECLAEGFYWICGYGILK